MSAKSPDQFPHPFYRIEIGAVGWQEIKANAIMMFIQPWFESLCMMPTSIVENNNHEMILASMTKKLLEKHEKGGSIEFFIQVSNQASVKVTDSSKNTDALARWGVKHDWIDVFRWYPHGASGAVLLKMAFIFIPEVNAGILGDSMEFFYMHVVIPGRHVQLKDEVSAYEIPSA